MSRRPWFALSAAVLLALAPVLVDRTASAQPAPEQTVWLKNGGFVRGALIELVPGDHVTVQLATGEIRRIPAAEIDRMSTSTAPPASSGATAAPPAGSGATTPPAGSGTTTTPAGSGVAPTTSAAVPSASGVPAPFASAVMLRVVAPTGVEIQGRPRLDPGPWGLVCRAPCDLSIPVVDREFRAGGSNVQPSHTFVLEPGERPVRVEVKPGRADLHRWGTRGYLVGLPLALLGGIGLGIDLGTTSKSNEIYGTIGLATVIAGGALVLSSLPLLYMGQTRVLNDKGIQVARRRPETMFLPLAVPIPLHRRLRRRGRDRGRDRARGRGRLPILP